MLNLYCNPCTDLGSTVLPHLTLHAFIYTCVAFLGLKKAGDVCSGRVSVRGKCLTLGMIVSPMIDRSLEYAKV